MASKYELAHRVEGKDSRRLLFQHQTDLLGQLSDDWAERLRQYHERVLENHPFDDNVNARVALYVSLRASGLSEDDAERESRDTYPRPAGGSWPKQRS